MNVKEGMRRFALLLGAVGAIVGGFASYLELQSILNQREHHNKFERLAASNVVEQQRKILQSDPYALLPDPSTLPQGVPATFSAAEMEEMIPLPSNVNSGGIKTITWAKGTAYTVGSIETEDGQQVYPTPAPNRWLYLFAAILPLLGFALPWGLVRAVGWVGAGFSASPK